MTKLAPCERSRVGACLLGARLADVACTLRDPAELAQRLEAWLEATVEVSFAWGSRRMGAEQILQPSVGYPTLKTVSITSAPVLMTGRSSCR